MTALVCKVSTPSPTLLMWMSRRLRQSARKLPGLNFSVRHTVSRLSFTRLYQLFNSNARSLCGLISMNEFFVALKPIPLNSETRSSRATSTSPSSAIKLIAVSSQSVRTIDALLSSSSIRSRLFTSSFVFLFLTISTLPTDLIIAITCK